MDALPPGYRLGPARLSDLPAIAGLEAAVFPEPLSLGRLLRLWLQPGTRYLVIRDRTGLAAYFGLRLEGSAAHVLANATAPAHRRRGLAGALLRAGEDLAARHGARCIWGEVRRGNTLQLRILEARGWTRAGLCPRFFGNGEDAWLVLRILGDPPARG